MTTEQKPRVEIKILQTEITVPGDTIKERRQVARELFAEVASYGNEGRTTADTSEAKEKLI